ncbi:hypothetical protein [Pelodictyon phaeoclathratiforme]|jgi:hypothetical protein|uniref:Uncharacterized protein n=1 Tax=Pelodictyon phaeoclathratiforme (strain DSM 5477 / BU-1) TaxID=324925 RepID=B4SFD9_PELPB|nr:hypothetical protein [Pelodictyon phaeoclathratiforme]ACF44718.1 conserved hypothetical protein [Pelodictyon phaeoclathratiforme BU-1]MBV5290677.1 hypothetical protein [Pelodictyon phaeoclathratiforme]
MSKSLIACAIDARECAIVRLKTAGGGSYSLSGCKTLPFGLDDLASGNGKRLLKKLDSHLNVWPDEELALCFGPKNYLPLPASFPAHADTEKCKEYCKIEAGYFLNQPEEYHCDSTDYGVSQNGLHKKKILLFYPAEPCRRATEHFATTRRILFSGTPQPPLLHLSKFAGERQVILEIENNYLLFRVSGEGRIETFSCHQVKNRKESEYFTIKALVENPICRETEVQLFGSLADKTMMRLIQKETSMKLKPLSIPPSIPISNLKKFSTSSAIAVKAISTALMALDEQKRFTLFSD